MIVSLVYYWKYAYTGVESKKHELLHSKIQCGIIIFFCFVNMIIIVHSIYDKNKRIVIYLINYINHKYQ